MNNGPQYRPSNCRPAHIRYCKLLLENLNVDLMLFSVLCATLDVVQKYLPITAPERGYHTLKKTFSNNCRWSQCVWVPRPSRQCDHLPCGPVCLFLGRVGAVRVYRGLGDAGTRHQGVSGGNLVWTAPTLQ